MAEPVVIPPAEPPPAEPPPAEPPPAEPPPAEPPPAEPPPAEPEIVIPDELKSLGVDDSFIDTYKILAASLPEDQRGQLMEAGKKILEQQEAASTAYWKGQDETWTKSLKEDKDIGGDNYDANMVKVNKVLATFDADGELVGYLKSIHHQSCAPLVKFIARMAPHFSEDVLVRGGDSGKKGDVPLHVKMGYDKKY